MRRLSFRGVIMPGHADLYGPILAELAAEYVQFAEETPIADVRNGRFCVVLAVGEFPK